MKHDPDKLMEREVEKLKAKRQAHLESQPGYTQQKNRSQLERDIAAIEYLAVDMKRLAEQAGREVSWEDARKTMENIANKADRERR